MAHALLRFYGFYSMRGRRADHFGRATGYGRRVCFLSMFYIRHGWCTNRSNVSLHGRGRFFVLRVL